MLCCHHFNALKVRAACNDNSVCYMQQEIKNNLTPTQNKPSLCFNCLHQLAGTALFFKELYRRRLRPSLCLFAVLLAPFLSHMWRQLSGASMLLDYPTNQQSFCNS